MMINICVIAINFYLVVQCDFDPRPYLVHIKPGDRQAYFDVTVKDDDIYEGTESFSIVISNPTNSHVQRCGGYSSIVTITDDESRKKLLLCYCICTSC